MRKTYPSKQDINLAQRVQRHRNLGATAVIALLLAAAVGLFWKFGVVEQLDRLQAAEQAAAQAEQTLAQMQSYTADYDAVLEEYQSYTLAGGALSGGADPMECLDLIEAQLMSRSRVSSFTAADGLIAVQFSGVTLQEVSAIYSSLMASGPVAGVQVYTAATEEDGAGQVAAAMTIQLRAGGAPAEEEEAAS